LKATGKWALRKLQETPPPEGASGLFVALYLRRTLYRDAGEAKSKAWRGAYLALER
jgi:hypothetical protein